VRKDYHRTQSARIGNCTFVFPHPIDILIAKLSRLDLANNCRRLWPLIYGREIDPRKEIIAPALAIRKAGYGEPTRDYKQELRDALKL
jgi:hypothetical protein